ncbi:MAG: hypothetical protein A3J35_02965 [Gammaproteobacteria bacterium RIFCSPLOWO2_02_FULL_52_10]|nr:MAG: hypothetical protein A3J35_02965 [Gammaproteobacteria bacterium RIFCSPLOWO2_02_FULL_52_10]
MPVKTIISGGQSGVDRAALDAAINNHIVHGGWCPKGRLAEDGTINRKYQLKETHSTDYAVRTAWNVRDADATLILNAGRLEGGTRLTIQLARTMKKPLLAIDVNLDFDHQLVWNWILEHRIEILNIAGPRESKQPGIYQKAYKLLDSLLKQ